jgi:hypothetical protein
MSTQPISFQTKEEAIPRGFCWTSAEGLARHMHKVRAARPSEENFPDEGQANPRLAHCDEPRGESKAPPHERRTVMKKMTTIAAILLASLAAAGSASAQDHSAKANIPFGFYVDSKWVPAGAYTLTSDVKSPDIINIRNEDS